MLSQFAENKLNAKTTQYYLSINHNKIFLMNKFTLRLFWSVEIGLNLRLSR